MAISEELKKQLEQSRIPQLNNKTDTLTRGFTEPPLWTPDDAVLYNSKVTNGICNPHYSAIVAGANTELGLHTADTIVEIGSGQLHFQDQEFNGVLFAVDPYQAPPRIRNVNIRHIKTKGDFYPTILNNSTDLVRAINSFHLFPDLANRMREYRRVLKPGGNVAGIEILGPGVGFLYQMSEGTQQGIVDYLLQKYDIDSANIPLLLARATEISIDLVANATPEEYGADQKETGRQHLRHITGFSRIQDAHVLPHLTQNITAWLKNNHADIDESANGSTGPLHQLFLHIASFTNQFTKAQTFGYKIDPLVNAVLLDGLHALSADAQEAHFHHCAHAAGLSSFTKRILVTVEQTSGAGLFFLDGAAYMAHTENGVGFASGRLHIAQKPS